MGSIWLDPEIMLRTLFFFFGGWKLDLGLNKPEVGEIVGLICWLYRIQ